ncbi:hypothetical protein HRE53_30685 (plasmid) [Acaryochloris sp. 'Moss Beach']|uniref:hypothetical protein n=1 Tax=Acaryochloris sp. 'Moss Beach' TaxID=2740837 RepID=UPI001F1A570A|nr:hypothetical protein [Acaryochloris sp. 'Moss Beach']UJB72952.1 hypothetical protein HRE53_30685 [Acaryochloris sp. 'Moss Beach']
MGASHLSRSFSAFFGVITVLGSVAWTIATFYFIPALGSAYFGLSIGVGIAFFVCGVMMVQMAAPWSDTPTAIPKVLKEQIDHQMQIEYLGGAAK